MTYRSSLFVVLVFFILLSCQGSRSTSEKGVNDSFPQTKNTFELDDRIWQVFQDSRGDFWFGSNGNGLYRYDGKMLSLYTEEAGLIDNTIRDIQEDKYGNIYIGTPTGVSKYDGSTFKTLHHLDTALNDWKLDPGDLWFNCNGNHLYRCDGEWLYELQLPEVDLVGQGMATSGVQFSGMNNSAYAVYGIDKDKEGNLWLGTITAGAFRYDGESFLWIGEQELSTLPDGRVPGVRSMLQDKEGYMWLSNFYSKYMIDSTAHSGYTKSKAVDIPDELSEDRILYFNSGLIDKEGDLWMTTYGGGVWKYDGQQLTNTEITNSEGTVLIVSIYQDREGVMWLGTDNDGVYKQEGEDFVKFRGS